METFTLATPEKIPIWSVCRENSLFSFLGPEGRYSLISSPKGHDHHWRMLGILKKQLLPAVAENRPELVGNFILHQDNAPPREARIVTEFLVEQGIETLQHPIHLTLLRVISGCLTP